MKQFLLILLFTFLFSKAFTQTSIDYPVMVRFACDTCAYDHNPLAYLGGNIISADIINSPDGNYLKLMSGSTIDTNAVPAYFDIYLYYSDSYMNGVGYFNGSPSKCAPLRVQNIVIDYTIHQGFFRVGMQSPGYYKMWLASALNLPRVGESTYNPDPNNSSSQLILKGGSGNFFEYSLNQNTPVWKDWAEKSKINMWGFTALTPNTEYRVYEVWINYVTPTKIAAYDCWLPGAVKEENLKEQIKIYPLPSSEYINIEIPDASQKYLVQLLSNSGEIVYQEYHNGNSTVPVSNLSKGLYLMKINIDDHYYTEKIVKE